MSVLDLSKEELSKAALTIAMLSADGVQRANSGHPGMPMGSADQAALLWLKYLKFNPKDPNWVNRDRFVLSNGHGSMLQYSLLHLAGFDLSIDDLKNFRQWHSKTPGHPESFMTPGVECTTGPLGQGIANAVGMALGKKILAERYNTDTHNIIDHKVYCFVGDGCLMEGISSEASSIAGHLGLGDLIVLYDDNHISIAGDTNLTFSEDVIARYNSYGWHTQSVDGHDFSDLDAAIKNALQENDKPSFIACRTVIGKGSPNKENTAGVHGSPLGDEELALTKNNLGWPADSTFYVPEEVADLFSKRRAALEEDYSSWNSDFNKWAQENGELAEQFSAQLSCAVPADLEEQLLATVPADGKKVATRKLSGAVLQAAAANVNSLIGGSADLEPSTLTVIKDSPSVSKDNFSGVNIHFGVREHAMGALMNGLSYYGGFLPFGSTFLTFSDYMRPAIRIAALSKLRGLFIFTHDSVFLGEDGPTHQAVEHLSSYRSMPNVWVMRPSDGVETAVCYRLALERDDGPCFMSFTRQSVEPVERAGDFDRSLIAKGAYSVLEPENGAAPELVIVATGSEVPLALQAAEALATTAVRVVSMPCVELFKAQSTEYQQQLIPAGVNKVVVEAGISFGWRDIVGGNSQDTLVIGVDDFGHSAPAEVIAEKLGFTPDAVVEKIKKAFSL